MKDPNVFKLVWKQGGTVINTTDVQRKDNLVKEGNTKVIRFPELAQKIEQEWKSTGSHREGSDKKFDQAVLHCDNDTPYVYIVGVIDAIYKAKRDYTVGGKAEKVPAFNVTFAVN
jgi:hypothetical protein